MNNFFKKIIYKDIPITEYAAITVTEMLETVVLRINDTTTDISKDHWALCLKPVIIGVWLNKAVSFSPDSSYTLLVKEKQEKLAEVKLDFFAAIEEQDGVLLLLRFRQCKLYHTSFIGQLFLFNRHYRKPGFSFSTFRSYVAAFSYPRKVRLISFQDNDYYSIFPMDFVGNPGQKKRYVFGLRHTNQALPQIIQAKKLVVSEVPFTAREDIYKLGAYHSAPPPPKEQLPFKTVSTRDFGFPVPEWVNKYNEIRITRTLDIGSHMLLWGESVHEEVLSAGHRSFYHIHFLLQLFQQRKGVCYSGI